MSQRSTVGASDHAATDVLEGRTERHLVADLEARAAPVGHEVDDGRDVAAGGEHDPVARVLALLEVDQRLASQLLGLGGAGRGRRPRATKAGPSR